MKLLLLSGMMFFSTVILSCTEPIISKQGATIPTLPSIKEETKEGWEVEWQRTLIKAKKESRVVVYGAPGSEARQALTEPFQTAYPGISVEFTGLSGGQVAAKIRAERAAGLYLVDINIHGAGSIIPTLVPFALPLDQFLILPDVRDGKNWFGGNLEFADSEGKSVLAFTGKLMTTLAYNPSMLAPEKVANMSFWDLTAPEWKEKLLMTDPRVSGPGQGPTSFVYWNPQLGPDYLKALNMNGVIFGRDDRLMLEWVGRGKYPAVLWASTTLAVELIKGGLPIKLHGALKEGTTITAAYGNVIYMDKAPHPNAAKIYLNWLLTKEAQTLYSQATGGPSRRLDVPTSHITPELVPKPGIVYSPDYTEEAIMRRPAMVKFVTELWGK